MAEVNGLSRCIDKGEDMKVLWLNISNVRSNRSAELLFDGHHLMVGSNNVGKSTLCEALDLVLGPDRLNRFGLSAG